MRVKLDNGAYVPERAHAEDAGLDLKTPISFVIPARGSYTVDTGVHCEIPYGYFGKLESKSGLNVHKGVVSCGGVIDSGFDGSIAVKLYNMTDQDVAFTRGQKIVQIVVQPCLCDTIQIVNEISGGQRGSAGFGSTGA